VLAAGLLFSPIAWHNYLMLLWPGVLVLVPLGLGALTAAALAVAVVPVSWNAEWPPESVTADVARSLYCVILLGYWVVLLSSSVRDVPVPAEPDRPASTSAAPES
jgi:arabinofuranan 3-O-arabinosyltransferase